MCKAPVYIVWVTSVVAAYLVGQWGQRSADQTDKRAWSPASSQSLLADQGRQGTTQGSQVGQSRNTGSTSPTALVAAIRENHQEMLSPLTDPSSLKLLLQFSEFTPEESKEAFAEVDSSIQSPHLRTTLLSILLNRMVGSDAPGTLDYVEKNVNALSSTGQGVKASMISSWAHKDPEAVWEHYRKNRDENIKTGISPESGMMLPAIFSSLGARDLDSALERLQGLDGYERSMAVNGLVMGSVWDEDRRGSMLSATESMDEPARQELRSQIVAKWANVDAEGALNWALTLPKEERGNLVDSATSNLMTTNPERGAAVLVKSTAPEDLPATYKKVVSEWSRMDPNAAGTWLSDQPQGPELDEARAHFASTVAAQDPESSMAWAQAVHSPSIRLEAIKSIYERWVRQDQHAADAALETADLTDSQIQSVLQYKEAVTQHVPDDPHLSDELRKAILQSRSK